MTHKSSSKIAIIGAGAVGLICAIEAGKKGHKVHLFDHAKKNRRKNKNFWRGAVQFYKQAL